MSILNTLVKPLQDLLNIFYIATKTIGIENFGVAIILFTIVIKAILYPLNAKQMKSMKLMQELQPKIKEIQQKNKDPQKAQMAIMELYKEYGANPLSGCLPLLIQMPILISLYRAISTFNFKLYKIPDSAIQFLWVHGTANGKAVNLTTADPYHILPILAVLSTFLLQKMSANTQDQTQKTMLYIMPIFFGVITWKIASGLVLYWVMFNILGMVQQYFINKQPLSVTVKEVSVKNEENRKNRKNH